MVRLLLRTSFICKDSPDPFTFCVDLYAGQAPGVTVYDATCEDGANPDCGDYAEILCLVG